MYTNVKFIYNRAPATISMVLMFIVTAGVIENGLDDRFTILEILGLVILITVEIYFFFRFWFPALNGKTAVELTPAALVNNISGRKINWNDIERAAPLSVKKPYLVIIYLKYAREPIKPASLVGLYHSKRDKFKRQEIINTKLLLIGAPQLIEEINAFHKKMSI